MILRILFICFPFFCFSQNLIDENQKKQGEWLQKHPNGKVRYEGSFVDDIPTGIFNHYNERGILKANLEYYNDGKASSARLYYANGQLSATGVYIGESKDQLWKYFNKN